MAVLYSNSGSVMLLQAECCFMSTETIRAVIRDGELRTATSTFTQLLRLWGIMLLFGSVL